MKIRKIVLGVVAVVIAVFLALYLVDMSFMPLTYPSIEARNEAFQARGAGLQDLAKTHGFTLECVETEANGESYTMTYEGTLPDGCEVAVFFYSEKRLSEPRYNLRLTGPSFPDQETCYAWDEQKCDFFYEAAAYLCQDRFSQADYRAWMEQVYQFDNSRYDIRNVLFEIGLVLGYASSNDDGTYHPEISVNMVLY